MQHDEIINCPKSGGDLCYKIEVNKDITNYYSMSCGFWTNSLMKKGSQFFNEQWEILPELYKDLAWEDPNTELIWFPSHDQRCFTVLISVLYSPSSFFIASTAAHFHSSLLVPSAKTIPFSLTLIVLGNQIN